MNTKTIEHKQMARTATDSECNLCAHDTVCKRLAGMEALVVPTPFTVVFECEHFKPNDQVEFQERSEAE